MSHCATGCPTSRRSCPLGRRVVQQWVWAIVSAIWFGATIWSVAAPAEAQPPGSFPPGGAVLPDAGQPPGAVTLPGPVRVPSAYAAAGEPYGVGRWTIPIGQIDREAMPRLLLREADGRVLYPAMNLIEAEVPEAAPQLEPPTADGRRIGGGRLLRRLRTAIETTRNRVDPPTLLQIDFLFTGDAPLQLSVDGVYPAAVTLPISGAAAPSDYQGYYAAYVDARRREAAAGDYPPLYQSFLLATLAQRLGVPASPLDPERGVDDPLETLELLAGTERLRDAVAADVYSGSPSRLDGNGNADATLPLPQPPLWDDPQPPAVEAAVEPIALAVPPDCSYIRFGSFSHYLWFRDLTAARGGGLMQTIMLRGSDAGADAKVETMLGTRTTLAAKLFGDTIIGEMALIGHDLYLQEGPSLGVLFTAKDIDRLLASIDAERQVRADEDRAAAAEVPGVAEVPGLDGVDPAAADGQVGRITLQTLEIAGRPVTLLSDPLNRVRSFRVVDGDYLLLTTSRTLVEEFLAVRDGGVSLGSTAQFRYARSLSPLAGEYEVFGYFSPQFFQRLLSPQYQIELRRRHAAAARIAAVEMAGLMAHAEAGAPANLPSATAVDAPSLTAAGYLSESMLAAADGSQVVQLEGELVDSRRGGRGHFLPVADVPVTSVTAAEARRYGRLVDYLQANWNSTEPVQFTLKRFQSDLGDDVQRVAIEAYVSPLDEGKLGRYANFLAPPVQAVVSTPPDDLISAQVHLAGQSVLGRAAPDSVLFAGLKDAPVPAVGSDPGLLEIYQQLSRTPFYVGAWPLPGYLDLLPLGLGGASPDAFGFSRALIGMWRWQGNGFSMISFDRGLLEQAIPHLGVVAAPDPAQARLRVGQLGGSQLAPWINTLWYRRAVAASLGNLRLLDAMDQQFKLPPSEALATVEHLLDTHLVCPAGGEYVVVGSPGQQRWESTAIAAIEPRPNAVGIPRDVAQLPAEEIVPPAGYQADWLAWMRGLVLNATQAPRGLTLLGYVDITPLPPPPEAAVDGPTPLPPLNFDIFGLSKKLFGGEEPNVAPPEQREF